MVSRQNVYGSVLNDLSLNPCSPLKRFGIQALLAWLYEFSIPGSKPTVYCPRQSQSQDRTPELQPPINRQSHPSPGEPHSWPSRVGNGDCLVEVVLKDIAADGMRNHAIFIPARYQITCRTSIYPRGCSCKRLKEPLAEWDCPRTKS